jgi:antitoxin component YwqK of YwqJK toxin-antitoxin module
LSTTLFKGDYRKLEAKVTYLNGQKDGPAESYYENGQLREKINWKDGTMGPIEEFNFPTGSR